MKGFILFSCAAFLIMNFITRAEETVLEEIVVTATKTEQEIQKTGSSVTVITREEIDRAGYATLEEALRNVPGITVVSSGPFGATAEVSIRGSKNYGHTLVLIDGVPANDPISIQRSFDFAHITLDNVERIEVVRGPHSTLYGSDAMAGVINIITRKGKEGRHLDFTLRGGQHNTIAGSMGISGAGDNIDYSFSASRLNTRGIPKAFGGIEDDGYKNMGFSARLGYQVFDSAELDFSLRYTDSKTSLDAGAFTEDPMETGCWENLSYEIGFGQAINTYWDHRISAAFSSTERNYRNLPAGTDNMYTGSVQKVEWRNNLYPSDSHLVTAGIEYQEEKGSSRGIWGGFPVDFPEKTAATKSFYIQDQVSIAGKLHITPGIRIDSHQMFGNETTYRVSAAHLFPKTGTRLKANYGTGFKAPTLYQLYDAGLGNINLQPEKNTGYDFGFEQKFMGDKGFLAATYFSSSYEDMIDWAWTGPNPWDGEYRNFQEVRAKGLEAEARINPVKELSFAVNYTFLDTEDMQTGQSLLRRPRHKIGFITGWQISRRAHVNIIFHRVGERKDAYWDPFLFQQVDVKMGTYTKTDLHHSYQVTDNLEIFLKVENIFDADYQEIAGYSTPGRSFYAGIRGRF